MPYTKEVGDKICLALSEGTSLRTICKEIGISPALVCNWLAKPELQEFTEQYSRARDAMADTLAEDILDIADNESLPADSRRIRVDVRKWYAGKVKPKKYGDSTQVKHADAEGGKLTISSVLGEISGRSANLPRAEEIPE